MRTQSAQLLSADDGGPMEIVTDIQLDPRNYRRHSKENKELIKKSLTECGAGRSILMDNKGQLIAGNGVFEQAKKLNIPTKIVQTDGSELVVVQRTDLAPEDIKRKKLAIMDNSASDSSEFDVALLVEDFSVEQVKELGVKNPKLDVEKEREIVEDVVPVAAEHRVKTGDIWQLGRHRLICADSTDPNNIKILMNGEKADLLLTDPPYNVNVEGANGKKIANDSMDSAAFAEFIKKAMVAAASQLKPGGCFYIWHADTESIAFRQGCNGAGLSVRQCLIWNKNIAVISRQDYNWKHEPCLYGWKEGAAHYFAKDFTQTTVQEPVEPKDIAKMTKDEMRALLEQIYAQPTTVIDADKPSRNEDHPTMKPLKLIARLIRNSSKKDEKVLDTFGGSGSTLIACEQMDRSCYTCELDPAYCDVIVARWEKFTGREAVLCK